MTELLLVSGAIQQGFGFPYDFSTRGFGGVLGGNRLGRIHVRPGILTRVPQQLNLFSAAKTYHD